MHVMFTPGTRTHEKTTRSSSYQKSSSSFPPKPQMDGWPPKPAKRAGGILATPANSVGVFLTRRDIDTMQAARGTRPTLSQFWSFKFRLATFLSYINFADRLISMLLNCEKVGRGWPVCVVYFVPLLCASEREKKKNALLLWMYGHCRLATVVG